MKKHYRSISRHNFILQFFLLFVLCYCPAFAQVPDFNFRQIGSEEGLNNPNIFNIQQHENGLMYFTTQNGIYYYDGYSFSRLVIDSLKSNALETAVIKDEDELFLSVRGEGIASFNLHSGEYRLPDGLKVEANNANQILVTDDHAYLLTSQIKLLIIDRRSGTVKQDEMRRSAEMNVPYCLFKTRAGKILVGRANGLYDITTGEHKKLPVLSAHLLHANDDSHELAPV